MADLALFSLILVALAIGYFAGRAEKKRRRPPSDASSLSSEYFVGLNYLLNEQTDEAIESFIRALEINSDTVETFVVLGRLFRQRGEIEKAIQAHQDLLARPSLTREQTLDVQLELAHDYQKAGLLDRAETLLEDIVQKNWKSWKEAFNTLLSIYEVEKEWQKAIVLVGKLKGSAADEYSFRLSHYHCELAEQALNNSDLLQARKSLRLAGNVSKSNARVSLLQGALEIKAGNYRDAIRCLERIADQDQGFVPESITMLEQCYGEMRSRRGLTSYLGRCLRERPTSAVVMASARLISDQQGEKEAGRFMAEQIIKRPSLKGLNALIDMHLHLTEGRARQNLMLLRDLTGRLAASKPVYQCGQCGFTGKELHWNCPKCHEWGAISPILGLEGE
ncbi:lipopolysaccharide assembly protein LapB [Sansalvadorimonas sp. 2012CJ34-2]|uniref:Lipopolysaccharide assembly protein B n=1 Tax=Parendozoicomonas callyspongiae TaxID=2942213 RepID=A0ABT0PIW6_9GAMM|nr:lipopolysaccharide assembly protein LapB [Sansalvadorimonas sp. 2012CJ34-2]MCL6271337.1 lipopolysaccharide assembly protein LapB [Sansalvadorimonas sp. 2012CJ34-2]